MREVLAWAERYSASVRGDAIPRFRRVVFDYVTLYRNYEELVKGVHGIDGIASGRIDETGGRIVLGIAPNALGSVRTEIAHMAFPPGMVVLEPEDRPSLTVTLQDSIRPLVGGLQIDNGGGACTLGHIGWKKDPNTMWPDYSAGGFALTASHCTSSRYVMTGDAFYQPDPTYPVVAFEADEPPVLSYNGSSCNWPTCQMADVAVLSIFKKASFSVGYAAMSHAASPPTVPQYWGTWYISNSVQGGLTGETVTKVGRTTGQTSGQITASCVDQSSLQYPNLYTLCSQTAQYASDGGDSGAPVFIKVNQPGHTMTPRPVGSHWGSAGNTAYLSPMSQIYSALAHAYIF